MGCTGTYRNENECTGGHRKWAVLEGTEACSKERDEMHWSVQEEWSVQERGAEMERNVIEFDKNEMERTGAYGNGTKCTVLERTGMV